MDFYPTRYSALNNTEINELFRSHSWGTMAYDERIDAIQELENRVAEGLGNQPCEVCIEEINSAVYGYYNNGMIFVNRNIIDEGVLRFEDRAGNTMEYFPDGVNVQIMDTIHHENYHAFQDDVLNNRLEYNGQEVELWRANEEMYISSAENSILYRIQAQERDAFRHAEVQVKIAFEEIEMKYGKDAGYQEYLIYINQNSYENALVVAKEIYEDEYIQDNLDNHMLQNYQENYAGDNDSFLADVSESV